MNKGENHLKGGHITVKIFSRIKTGDGHFGKDYHERTKALLRFFRSEYKRMKTELETPSYFRRKIIRNYIYKGPVLEWYTRIKILLEKNYTLVNNYVPREASIVDIGCGYGMMSYMLCLTSEKRNILGIDYDSEKIELAENCLLKNERIRFVAADAITFDVADTDVFLLSDVLHYMPEDKQDQLLKRCIAHLNPGGSIIIRDADKDLQKRHIGTRYTEFFSTHFGYNKALNKQLYFFSGKKIIALAKQHGMEVNVIDNTRFTSNVFYILTKTPEKEHELC
jgi:2-polyprenyl-3-methyl-5-hydroxy-6-metoxy-1,4-benzoquinol methylase